MTTGNYLSGGGTHAFPSTAFTADGQFSHSSGDGFEEFTINNPHAGVTQFYSIHLFSDFGEGGDFGFSEDGGVPTGGHITSVQIRDASDHTYATFCGSFNDNKLVDFWNALQTSGPKAALDQLIGAVDLTGSSDADQVETYGPNSFYSLGDGNDILDIFHNFTTAYGGAGSDTFQIEQSGLVGLELHGGFPPVATAAADGVNAVDFHVGGTLAFAKIDGITSFLFSGPGDVDSDQFNQFIYLNTDQLPGGTTPVFQVTGSDAHHGNEIVIEPSPGDGPEHIDLRNVTVSNFTRLDQAFWFDFVNDKFNDTAFGALNARNVFHFGSGNDHAIGGNLADVFFGGHGNDTFNGRGGIDVAHYDGNRGQYTVTKINAHTYRVHDNRHGSPEGTDTLVNVEYLKFANKAVLIGTLPPTSAVSALHTHDLAATSAHHFDLFV